MNHVIVATDTLVFTIIDQKLHVLLIKMKKKEWKGTWALPGGLVNINESLDGAAKRHLKDKTSISGIYMEQLYTFGDPSRDPDGHIISTSYMALIPADKVKLKTSKEYEAIEWKPLHKLPKLAYDHKEVIKYGVQRLRWKLEYTNAVYSLLPDEFTLSELQDMYEIILDRELDKRNFRKKILSLKMLKKLGKKRKGEANRPAELFSFKDKKFKIVEVL